MRFPIRDEYLNVIGYLRGFDESHLRDDALIETMARAHTRYKEFFLTQFDVTPDNKRSWLENSVLGSDKKMLFLVETLESRIVGQDGFTILDGGVFSQDSTMRWERGGHRDLFLRNGYELAAICFILLGCDGGGFAIFKKNIGPLFNVILSERRLGIQKIDEYPLVKSNVDGHVIYTKAKDNSQINTGEILVEYGIEKEVFFENNAGLIKHPCWEKLLLDMLT